MNPEFDNRFMDHVNKLVEDGDMDAITREKIILKLMNLAPDCQEGFIINDYPSDLRSAEVMEEYKGGLNAFVHLNLPDHVLQLVEHSRLQC